MGAKAPYKIKHYGTNLHFTRTIRRGCNRLLRN